MIPASILVHVADLHRGYLSLEGGQQRRKVSSTADVSGIRCVVYRGVYARDGQGISLGEHGGTRDAYYKVLLQDMADQNPKPGDELRALWWPAANSPPVQFDRHGEPARLRIDAVELKRGPERVSHVELTTERIN